MSSIHTWPAVVATYALPGAGTHSIDLPAGADALSVVVVDAELTLCARVDPESPPAPRRFHVYPTGVVIAPSLGRFLGTAVLDGVVLHVFEEAG